MPGIDKEKLIKLFHGQSRSADLWINQWQRYKDVGSVRNAALAIGKMAGIYYALQTVIGEDNVPEDITQKMSDYHEIWDKLHISKEIAAAISQHG